MFMLCFRRAKDGDNYLPMLESGRISGESDDYVMLAFDEDDLIGACSMEFSGRVGGINSLYVDNRYRNQGIGFGLVKAIMFVALNRGIKKVQVKNRCGKDGLFGRLGFAENPNNQGILELNLEGYFEGGC